MQETHQIPSNLPHTGNPYDPVTAVLYGQFIEAAYAMYDANPSNLTPPIFEFSKRISTRGLGPDAGLHL
jgi:hypothetical protein